MPKLLPKAHTIAKEWLSAAKEMEDGSELFLPVEHAKDAKSYIKRLRELCDSLSRDEPILAAQLTFNEVFRDKQLWVQIKKSMRSPLAGYMKSPDGTVTKIIVALDPDRNRKIKLMVRDGVSIDDMNNLLESPLTQAEIREHIQKGRFS